MYHQHFSCLKIFFHGLNEGHKWFRICANWEQKVCVKSGENRAGCVQVFPLKSETHGGGCASLCASRGGCVKRETRDIKTLSVCVCVSVGHGDLCKMFQMLFQT